MKVIYVDDEKVLLENFRQTVQELTSIDTLNLFLKSEDAINWAEGYPVDVAFLDIEMPFINGIELAKRLKNIDDNISIVFVTAFEQYAFQAFEVGAIGYLLKPYTSEDIKKELRKASLIHPEPEKEIQVRTMPDLLITVRGKPLPLRHTKKEELLALLIDRGETGITKGEAIACLWDGTGVSDSAYWTTLFRLNKTLDEAGISNLIITNGQTKSIDTSLVECDLYKMLKGDVKAMAGYAGAYLRKFSWAEDRNAQLNEIKKSNCVNRRKKLKDKSKILKTHL